MKPNNTTVAISLLICFTCGPGFANAQNAKLPELAQNTTTYSTAFGLRAGYTGAFTLKQKVGGGNAIEGLLGFWHHGWSATALFERNVSAFGVPGLNWYYGAGAHMSFANWHIHNHRNKENRYRYYYYENDFGIGVDGIIGLEYKIPQIPFALSIDAIPFVEVVNNGTIWGTIDPGFGIKLVF
jgi:hypothetical protein